MFVQMHMLQSMPPGNLNRDETGQPKKCLFGGVTRGRISSQCLKRNIRHSDLFREAFGDELGQRTRELPKMVADACVDLGIPNDDLPDIMAAIKSRFLKESSTQSSDKANTSDDNSKKDTKDGNAKTNQLVFFPPAFARKISELLVQLRADSPEIYDKFLKRNPKAKLSSQETKAQDAALKAFTQSIYDASKHLSVDICLFGRMTTSDLVGDVEATCQVAHAIGTHETIIESDYFTAMDDRSVEPGAAFMGTNETETFYNATTYYRYLNTDIASLCDDDHLSSMSPQDAGAVAATLLKAAALATPTGKQNSFAAHSAPEVILVEISKIKRPLSYANAFLKAVDGGPTHSYMTESSKALGEYAASMAAAYSPADMVRLLMVVRPEQPHFGNLKHIQVHSLDELAQKLAEYVTKGLENS